MPILVALFQLALQAQLKGVARFANVVKQSGQRG